MQDKQRGLFLERTIIIFLTAVITFSATAGAFVAWNYFHPSYTVGFEKKNVNIKNIEKFDQVRNILKNDFYKNVDENVLLEGAVEGMARSLNDPYTRYLTVDEKSADTQDMQGSYVGIGAVVTLDENDVPTVEEIYNGSPAQEAGLLPADKIVRVDGRDVTTMRDLAKITGMIKGKENTKVSITVFRTTESKLLEFGIIRKKVSGVNVSSEVLPDNIGYLKIEKFDYEVAAAFYNHMSDLLVKGINGLIIDLRDNPGGSYDQVVKIADMILPKGLIVYTEDKYKRKEPQYSDENCIDLPIAVLVNGYSASASEILAGAIKDNKWGKLIGTKTFGKGLVQEVKMLDDGSGLNVTIARYFTPSGVCIQGKGIKPDIEVQVSDKYKGFPVYKIPRSEDIQFSRAVEYIKTKIKK